MTNRSARGDKDRTPRSRGVRFPLPTALAVLLLAGWLANPGQARSEEPPGILKWNRATRRVDADLLGWTLEYTLKRIAAATGWEVYVEPGLEARISARIEDRPAREALAVLLADVNFALVPSASKATNRLPRLLVFRSSTSEATVAVRPPGTGEDGTKDPRLLENELIVRLRKGGKAAIEELARRLGAKVVGSIDSLNAYRLQFDDPDAARAARESLAGDENVASLEDNYAIAPPGQINRLGESAVPPLGIRARPITKDGSAVIVALLDSAIPAAGSAHADFLLPALSVAGAAPAPSADGISHGSAMFETVLQGLALTQTAADGTPVRVLPIDIFGSQDQTTLFQLAQGISLAMERGASVVNLSLSGPNASPLVQDLLRQGNAAGVMTFAAPGNEPTTAATYPAAYPEVIAVTASDRRGQVANYANRGNFVDLMAPGTSVVPFAGDTWVVNGTSVSTAYTSGLAAGLLADTGRKSADILAQLKQRLAFQPPAGSTPAPLPKP